MVNGKKFQVREEEIKNRVAAKVFSDYDCTRIIGNIDFCVSSAENQSWLLEKPSWLWAEAKAGIGSDIGDSLVQLILTIGKAKTYETHLPPPFLGAFDAGKIAFIPYSAVMHVFSMNDFNWNVTPSDHGTREFAHLRQLVSDIQEKKRTVFALDDPQLPQFIRRNFTKGVTEYNRLNITKNNFTAVFHRWREKVLPTIRADWEKARRSGIIPADFYLADLLSEDNKTLKEKLYVLLKTNHYEFDRSIDDSGFESVKSASFNDDMAAHANFWQFFNRPPRKEFWEYIINRRDLLVPQDLRERKGSYFTPSQWVELSQKYIADALGEDWQDEYYIWDCAAGTGNLLAGLTNKYNIWASTIDQADVDVMKDRIANGANLLEDHVFQFDFLNDDFSKCPERLQEIINDEEKRKKLVIYINPPYAEAANKKTVSGTGDNKTNVAVQTESYKKYFEKIGIAGRELFIQFLSRIYFEIPHAKIAQFSTIKALQAPNFRQFRECFLAKLQSLFIVPANTFDNVTGQFPIGFFVWDEGTEEKFSEIWADVFDSNAKIIGKKLVTSYAGCRSINDWLIETRKRNHAKNIGYISCKGADFQNQNYIYIINDKNQLPHPRGSWVTDKNLIEVAVYFAARKVIPADWLNDRDQFLYPFDSWKDDTEFQNDCLAFMLFSNNISIVNGENNFIPFTEEEVGAKERFGSHFMTDFISGKLGKRQQKIESQGSLISIASYGLPLEPLRFSSQACALFNSGRELWKYYHRQNGADADAALYDIRLHFQGIDENGRMKSSSDDAEYSRLNGNVRAALRTLAEKIAPKVFKHGFLKR